jgi:hypothetical protein
MGPRHLVRTLNEPKFCRLANADAVDATVDIARAHRGGADCGARDRAGPQHDAGSGDAT